MTDGRRADVQSATGLVPLYLQSFLGFCSKVRMVDDEDWFLRAYDANISDIGHTIRGHLEQFTRGLRANELEAHLEHMHQLLRDCLPRATMPDMYDHRYFFVPNASAPVPHGCSKYAVSGLALECMASVLRFYCPKTAFCSQADVAACKATSNPVVRGFLAEQIVLSTIGARGLEVSGKRFQPTTTQMFIVGAEATMLTQDVLTTLWIPEPYNYKAIDGFIRVVEKNAVVLCPLQVTLQNPGDHWASLRFFLGDFKKWKGPSTNVKARWVFVWICRKKYVKDIEFETLKWKAGAVGRGEKVKFEQVILSFSEVDERLCFLDADDEVADKLKGSVSSVGKAAEDADDLDYDEPVTEGGSSCKIKKKNVAPKNPKGKGKKGKG